MRDYGGIYMDYLGKNGTAIVKKEFKRDEKL
jgi:hypothetical protein